MSPIPPENTPNSPPRAGWLSPRFGVRMCASWVLLFGLVVMVGWVVQKPEWVRFYTSFPGMRFNAALCFALSGAALWLLDLGWIRWGQGLGIVVGLVAGITLVQTLFGVDLHIDQCLVKDVFPYQSYPLGRMSTQVSLCFMAFGAGCMVDRNAPGTKWGWVQALGAAGLGTLGGLSLVGYVFWLHSQGIGSRFTFMSVNGAVGMLLLGAGLFLRAWRQREPHQNPIWVSAPIGLSMLVATLVLWQALLNQERDVLNQMLQQEAQALRQDLEDDYQERNLGLVRVAFQWAGEGARPKREAWEKDAALYVSHRMGYRAMEWVDEQLVVRWVVPKAGNEKLEGLDLKSVPQRRAPFDESLRTGRSSAGPDIELLQGGHGFVHCLPVQRLGRPDGFVVAVFDISEWMQTTWDKHRQCDVEVTSGDRRLFASTGVVSAHTESGISMPLPFEGRTWVLHVYPTLAMRNQVHTLVPDVVLVAGISIAILVSLLMWAFQRALAMARRMQTVNARLELEVAEREKAEQALRQADLSRTLVVEHAVVGIALVRERRFEWANHRLAEMMGRAHEEILGAPTRVIYPDEETYVRVGQEGYPLLREGRIYEAEFQLRRADGSMFWCRFVGRALQAESPEAGSIWMFEDVDARVRTERMKRQFVSTVSHELRTPLTAIKGSLGLLKGGLGGTLDPKGQDLLHIALNNSDRLVRLVNEILDMEKLRSGRMEFGFEDTNVVEVLKEAAQGNLGLATQARVMLALDVDIPEARVMIDPHRLRQCLDNLVSNAVKFSPEGTRISLGLVRSDSDWVLSVSDEGRGMPANFLVDIFEPFTQVDGSDARDKGGTGLGLSITKSLVEGMHGRIWVTSRLGQGSTFFMSFAALN